MKKICASLIAVAALISCNTVKASDEGERALIVRQDRSAQLRAAVQQAEKGELSFGALVGLPENQLRALFTLNRYASKGQVEEGEFWMNYVCKNFFEDQTMNTGPKWLNIGFNKSKLRRLITLFFIGQKTSQQYNDLWCDNRGAIELASLISEQPEILAYADANAKYVNVYIKLDKEIPQLASLEDIVNIIRHIDVSCAYKTIGIDGIELMKKAVEVENCVGTFTMNSFKDDAAKNRMLDIMKDKSYIFCISEDSEFFKKFGAPIEAVSSSQYIEVTPDGKIRILCYAKYGWEFFETIVEKDDSRIQHIEINWSKRRFK